MSKIITATFNGHDLSDLLIINSLKRGVRLGRTLNSKNRKGKKGVDFLGYSSELISFNMAFTFKYNIKEKRELLLEILNVVDPKPLVFSDNPNKIYYAFPQGDINIAESSALGEGTITWEIPDGVSYSIQNYLFTNKATDGELFDYVTINNPGSEPIDLELSATFKSDNGFLGIESDTGTVRSLFGDMEEIDGYDYEISEKLFDDHFNVPPGWVLNNGVVPLVTNSVTQQGTFGYTQEKAGEGFARPTSYGPPTTSWSGPSLTKVIPADSEGAYPENWTAAFRSDFNTDGGGKTKANQVGHQSITFADQNNKIIVSVVIEDNTLSAEKSDLAIYIRNKRVYDSRNTTSYYVTARPGSSNHIKVAKIGNKINVELAFIGRKLSFDFSESDIFLRKVTFYSARYKALLPMQNNLIRALNVSKHNVEKWEEIPNKFMNGDKLTYGKSDRNIYCRLNEMNALEMRDVGSTLITAPPGESILYLAYSSFSDTPEVTLKGKARFII
ncbi:MAG: distal tail protein Dit [Carnobacterium inhibens]|uniref:distal tail protein Dit n=1 Tax=Carnobacterium sp. TaxID=48221 RepID=UPI0033149E37